jgi:hypothetical protein
MSRLTVFWPDECDAVMAATAPAARILPFSRPVRSRMTGSQQSAPVQEPRMDVISRARVMFENRRCRHCAYPVVKPLELDDALVNKTGLDIPGTATLVGFQCQSCEREWFI